MQEMQSKGLFKSKIRSVVFISGFLSSPVTFTIGPGGTLCPLPGGSD